MPYVKKLVMQGFKSFARKTEIPFENSMNVIVGPNGSGKSNIADALCFVLGRLSIKSIRAAKAANLLFSGNKMYKASNEAFVELIFDNADKIFSLDSQEVSIKRVVRRNGLSVYKINNEVKTRQELLELLGQAGIDPNGFNIVLQGEIATLVKSHPEERRKIIEEVAGISIYESRKEKSLRELEKTDNSLKEVSTVLKEKSNYLKNLDKDRQDALDYKKMEETIKRCKATIVDKNLKEKLREIAVIKNEIEKNEKEIGKVKEKSNSKTAEIENLQKKLAEINKTIQTSTGDEQGELHREISDLKAAVAGNDVRNQNFENRIFQNKEKERELKEKILLAEKEINQMQSSEPKIKEQQEKLKEYQSSFDNLETQRRKFYMIKSDLSTLENKRQEKEKKIIGMNKEMELIERSISVMAEEIKHAKSNEKAEQLERETKSSIKNIEEELINSKKKILELEKRNAVLEEEKNREERLIRDIVKMDVCPLCRNEITQEHIRQVLGRANERIKGFTEKLKLNLEEKAGLEGKIEEIEGKSNELKDKLREIEIEIIKLRSANEKKENLKVILKNKSEDESELRFIEEKIKNTRKIFETLKGIEEKYDDARLKLSEVSSMDIDVGTEISMKRREIERMKTELKASTRDNEDSDAELKKLREALEEENKVLLKKEKEEMELYDKFQRLYNERNGIQDTQKAIETEIIGFQHVIKGFEEKINYLKINKAQADAQIDSLKTEFNEFGNIELISAPLEQLREKLQILQIKLGQMGSINMRALEVYDQVKEQVSLIEGKVAKINEEKEKILKIIEDIDK
ncbi:MAG: AAA family ATPase, partial [Methanobacterium sp.]|nr:AAA family ATPase [Methanobacterium sp.]